MSQVESEPPIDKAPEKETEKEEVATCEESKVGL